MDAQMVVHFDVLEDEFKQGWADGLFLLEEGLWVVEPEQDVVLQTYLSASCVG